jgi:hypothetical protein
MQPLDPTAPLAITLQAQQWNMILNVLHDAPYRIAAPLIAAITDQAQAAQQPPPVAEPMPPAKPNGADDHAPY